MLLFKNANNCVRTGSPVEANIIPISAELPLADTIFLPVILHRRYTNPRSNKVFSINLLSVE
jgi:hypothetical protein